MSPMSRNCLLFCVCEKRYAAIDFRKEEWQEAIGELIFITAPAAEKYFNILKNIHLLYNSKS